MHMAFPCMCRFCDRRFTAQTLSNCCAKCWRKYDKLQKKHGKKAAIQKMEKRTA